MIKHLTPPPVFVSISSLWKECQIGEQHYNTSYWAIQSYRKENTLILKLFLGAEFYTLWLLWKWGFFFALRCRVPMNDWAAWPMLAKFCQHFLFSSALVRGQKLGTGWHCSYSHSILSGLWGSYQVWGEDSCLSEFAIKNMFQHFLLAFDWMRHFVIFPSPSGFFKSCFIFLKNSKPFFNLFFSALKWALSLKLCDFGGF